MTGRLKFRWSQVTRRLLKRKHRRPLKSKHDLGSLISSHKERKWMKESKRSKKKEAKRPTFDLRLNKNKQCSSSWRACLFTLKELTLYKLRFGWVRKKKKKLFLLPFIERKPSTGNVFPPFARWERCSQLHRSLCHRGSIKVPVTESAESISTHPGASSERPPPSSGPVWAAGPTPPSAPRWPASGGPWPRRSPRTRHPLFSSP